MESMFQKMKQKRAVVVNEGRGDGLKAKGISQKSHQSVSQSGSHHNHNPAWSSTYKQGDLHEGYSRQLNTEGASFRGLTLRDMMKVTVPSRNTKHYRMQSMHYETGAGSGISIPLSAEEDISRPVAKKSYFAESYIPPGMSPPRSPSKVLEATFLSKERMHLSLSQIKRLALQDHQKKIQGKSLRRKTKRRRSFREGANNANQRGGSHFLTSHQIHRQERAASHRSAVVKRGTTGKNRKSKPAPTKYCYPNERKLNHLDREYDCEVPMVPPSRRKFAEVKEERTLLAAHGSSRSSEAVSKSREKDSLGNAQLRVEKILANVARGRAPDGGYGKTKPPRNLWPTNSYKT